MAKIVEGVALLAAGIALFFVAPELLITDAVYTFLSSAAVAIGTTGISLTLAGVAQALQAGPSAPFSVRQAAAPRQIVYGQCRVAGIVLYISTTNNGHDLNQVIAWGGHRFSSIDTIYIDGRATHIGAGGADNGNTYQDDSGNNYSFGSAVHVFHSPGTVPGTYFSDLGSRDSKWTSDCTLDGIAASYVRCTFDANKFSGMPGIKANVHGKSDIWDPRTQTNGYSNNAALIICDLLCNSDYGVGCNYATEIDEVQLIAAANLCDEQVALANGASESRYTLNGFFDTSSTPGDTLDAMLACCEGRISYSGGRWKIYPAAFYGSGLQFSSNDFAGPIKWAPRRKYRDLINTVRATYVSPKYPYAIVGYNQDNKDPNVWSGQWQPTDIPEYAQDSGHGYSSDANLAADGGVKLYGQRSYRFVTSVAMAQRLAKIFLMRNRLQGSGTLQMQLSAYQCLAQDVITVTFPALNWTNKYLEVQTMRFTPKIGSTATSASGNAESPSLYVELDVIETDPSVYFWSIAEERGVLNTASPQISISQQPNPPTSLVLESGADSAVIGTDGVVIPRIHASWIEPDDPFVQSGGLVELQYQSVGQAWVGIHLGPTITDYFITGVVTGHQYNVQIRSLRPGGAASGFMSAGPHTVSSTQSVFSTTNISGLGALATRNYVDFASGVIQGAGALATQSSVDLAGGQILNKSAQYLHYSTGLSIEQLRPLEPNAEQTTGKSVDLLADGQVYVRVKGTEAQGGIIVGHSYGMNIVPNPGFEFGASGSPVGDNWYVGVEIPATGFFSTLREVGYVPSTGACNLLIRILPNVNSGSGAPPTLRILSTPLPTNGGQQIFIGASIRWDENMGIPAGANIIQRIGLYCQDVNGNIFAEANLPDVVNNQHGAWYQYYGTVTVPVNTSAVRMQLCSFVTSQNTAIGNGLCADMRFDDVFCVPQLTSSTLLNPQGSIAPTQPILINYQTSKNSISVTWAQQSVYRSDGTSLTLIPGGITYLNLSASTSYYIYPYIDVPTSMLYFVNGAVSAPTGPSALMATQTALDGRIPIPPIVATTLSSTNGGSSGGTGGGSDRCPEAAELVEVKGKGQIPAGEVQAGDFIKGRSFRFQNDVFRRVLQVHTKSCVAWRIVAGHRVSPCEPVYFGDTWQPAYRASSVVDTQQGTKMFISVEAGVEDQEMNYYLVAGTPLLIHNAYQLPC